jgi:hypothetical protein
MSFQIPNSTHLRNDWYVQSIAHDFKLLDVWEFPICFKRSENDTLYKFRKIAVEPTFKDLFNNNFVGLLFKFRGLIGKLFLIDKDVNQLPIPYSQEFLTDRISKEKWKRHSDELNIDIRTNNYLDFKSVYSFEDETLNEISNKSEHALMHYSWIKIDDTHYKIQMASYVKHRSKLGPLYIKLIDPFKRKLVYPYIFNQFASRWYQHKCYM